MRAIWCLRQWLFLRAGYVLLFVSFMPLVMEMGFKYGRTEFEYKRRWDYGKVHQVYIII